MSKKPKLISAKAGLQAIESPLDAASFFNGLALRGIMHKCSYLSTTGSGEQKHYWVLDEQWLQVGANKRTMHPFKTEPAFVPEAMPLLLVAACEGLLAYAQAVRGAFDEQVDGRSRETGDA